MATDFQLCKASLLSFLFILESLALCCIILMHILFLSVKFCFNAFCLISSGNDDLFCASRNGCAVSLSDDSGGCAHSDAIRAISFGAGGALFASAGDDKLVKVWKTGPWRCIRTM